MKTEAALIRELNKKGYKYRGIDHLFKQERIPKPAVKIILKRFPAVYQEHRGTGGHLIRSLISASEPFDPKPLMDFFKENIYNSSVMWGVAHVIAVSPTTDISEYIKNQLIKEYPTIQRGAFVRGLPLKGGFKNDIDLKKFLKKIYDNYPLPVLDLLKKIATEDDIPFFEEKTKPINRSELRDIEKMIAHIKKRSKK